MENTIKTEIQREMHSCWIQTGRCGTIAAGTGAGKSRIPILEMERMYSEGILTNEDSGKEPVLLVVPTTKLRDENWPAEFEKWGYESMFSAFVKPICFASLKKERGKHYKLVILDEVHRVTDMAAAAFLPDEEEEDDLRSFFSHNLADAVMGLTATVPDPHRDPEKAAIINQVAPVVFTYSLDQGVEDGMIADYEIRVIQSSLDDKDKYIKAGTKDKPFMTTEFGQYQYLEKTIRRYRMLEQRSLNPKEAAKFNKLSMIQTMKRNQFLYNLRSKTELAERCLRHMAVGGKRTLVFCGSIAQCDKLLAPDVYHSKSGDVALHRFMEKEIDTLGVVNAVNEGMNLPDLDQSLICQVDSNVRNLTQRIGRLLRVREGHKAIIYILCVIGTADERWLEKSLEGFDAGKIQYYGAKGVPA